MQKSIREPPASDVLVHVKGMSGARTIPFINLHQTDPAGHWDTAITNSSCLRAALARALQIEVAVARGFAAAGELWDMSAFFDSIDIARLVEYSLDRDFLCWGLNLSLQVHTASRAFKEGPYVSHFIRPTGTSILAGCGRSIQFSRNPFT